MKPKKQKDFLDLTFRGSVKRFSFYTYTQLILHNVNLGGFLKEIKNTAFWFLYAKKDEFVFLNLMPTLLMLRSVVRVLEAVIFHRGKLMFVNNDLDLFWGAMHVAIESAEPFCVSRWVGGTLTNFKKLWIYFNRFLQYEKWSDLTQPSARLKFSLQGFAYLSSPPSLIFINSLKHSLNVANESHAVFIPSVSLVDIDTNSGDTAYMIPSNDDSEVSIDFFNKLFGQIVLINKYRLAKRFLAKKIRRTDSFLNKKAMHFWQRMFIFREKYEEMHTKSYRLCLRNWIALSGFRRTFAGLFVPNFLNKKIEGFVFKNLRTRNYNQLKMLKTMRIVKSKAKNLYFKYYKNFFFFKKGVLSLRYSILIESINIQLEWMLELIKKLSNITKDLYIRCCFWKKKGEFHKFSKLNKLHSRISREKLNLYNKYRFFLKKRYSVLKNVLKNKNRKIKKNSSLIEEAVDPVTGNLGRFNNQENNLISKKFMKFNEISKEKETFSWNSLFRRLPNHKNRTLSGDEVMAELRKKYKGMRYWVEVFKARPWLQVRKPLYFLNYPSNFKPLLNLKLRDDFVKDVFLTKKIQSISKINLKEKHGLEYIIDYFIDDLKKPSIYLNKKIESFCSAYIPVDFRKLISKNLHTYFDYIEKKYNTELWYSWFLLINRQGQYTDLLKQDKKVDDGLTRLNENVLYNFLTKKSTNLEKLRVDMNVEFKNELNVHNLLFIPKGNDFFIKHFVRASSLTLNNNKYLLTKGLTKISKNILKDGIKKQNGFLQNDKLFWLKVNTKYISYFSALSIKFFSLKKNKNDLMSTYDNIFNYYNSPLYLNYFFNSKVDKLARLQSKVTVNLKKKKFRNFSKKIRNKNNTQDKVYFEKNNKSQKKFHIKNFVKPQKFSDLFKAFHWIQILGRTLLNVESFALNKIISRYIYILKLLNKKKIKSKFSYIKLTFLIHRCFILILLKGLFVASRKNRRLFREVMSETFFKYSIHQKFFNTRLIFRLFYRQKKKKARWSVFSRAFFKNNANFFINPFLLVKNELDPAIKANLIDTNKFFYTSAQQHYKKVVFKKLFNDSRQVWRHGFRWSPRYWGIPARRASFFHMLETSKFSVKRKRKFILKARKHLHGKTLLEAYLKDFQYGRAKGYKHFFIIKEILSRIQMLKKKKWFVFMHMLKGNKTISKPFIKNDLEQFSHPKMFLLRNFGSKKFRNIKRQETQDKVSFIKWYAKQQRISRTFPGKMNTRYIIRLWTNRSMFFTY